MFYRIKCPTSAPSTPPTSLPSPSPSLAPTAAPSPSPSPAPTPTLTRVPSATPSPEATASPTSSEPTAQPSPAPTDEYVSASATGHIECGHVRDGSTVGGLNVGGQDAADHFYTFTATEMTTVTFSTCASDFNTVLRIHRVATGESTGGTHGQGVGFSVCTAHALCASSTPTSLTPTCGWTIVQLGRPGCPSEPATTASQMPEQCATDTFAFLETTCGAANCAAMAACSSSTPTALYDECFAATDAIITPATDLGAACDGAEPASAVAVSEPCATAVLSYVQTLSCDRRRRTGGGGTGGGMGGGTGGGGTDGSMGGSTGGGNGNGNGVFDGLFQAGSSLVAVANCDDCALCGSGDRAEELLLDVGSTVSAHVQGSVEPGTYVVHVEGFRAADAGNYRLEMTCITGSPSLAPSPEPTTPPTQSPSDTPTYMPTNSSGMTSSNSVSSTSGAHAADAG